MFIVSLLSPESFSYIGLLPADISENLTHPTQPICDFLIDPMECPAGPAFAIACAGIPNGNYLKIIQKIKSKLCNSLFIKILLKM